MTDHFRLTKRSLHAVYIRHYDLWPWVAKKCETCFWQMPEPVFLATSCDLLPWPSSQKRNKD